MSANNGGYVNADEWYAALVKLANGLMAGKLVRDREAWITSWENRTPEQEFFNEYPEYWED